MKRYWIAAALVICLLGCSMISEALAQDVWMMAVHVGKGDAIFVGVDDAVALIDTGYPYVRGRILAAMDYMGIEKLDAVLITHTDKDHVGGLEWLAESDIPVEAWYASAMYMDTKESKHPLALAAALRGKAPQWLKAGQSVRLGSAVLSVLAPIVMAEDKDDNNSLVMMLETEEGNILLAGDMEFPEEETVIDSGADLRCDVLKVGNHGDDDASGEEFVQYARPKIAVISTSSSEKPGTPAPKVLRRLQKVGAQTVSTEDASLGILVRLKGGEPSVDLLDIRQTDWKIALSEVDAEDDRFVLRSSGSESVDLSGWYLYSERGGEMFVMPEGTVLSGGGTLTIGTASSSQETDLLWDDKKVIHQKKNDLITLYDAAGFPVSQMDNGL